MRKKRKVCKVLVGTPEENRHSEDRGVDGRIGSRWILGRLAGGGGVEWIGQAQDGDRWRAVVNAVMNLRVLAPRGYLVRGKYPITITRSFLQSIHSITDVSP
jgi:hypothetical protein